VWLEISPKTIVKKNWDQWNRRAVHVILSRHETPRPAVARGARAAKALRLNYSHDYPQ